jgi:hypothetical protein
MTAALIIVLAFVGLFGWGPVGTLICLCLPLFRWPCGAFYTAAGPAHSGRAR